MLVKIQQLEDVQNELKEKNRILEKMSNLVQGISRFIFLQNLLEHFLENSTNILYKMMKYAQVVIKSTDQFEQLDIRLKSAEMSLLTRVPKK